ncbi:MAG: polysaccharide deacetylase family protein [Treponema sp.]|nr:polysaccharide deacetylase family protein [Treponema sp.]
MRNYFYLLIAIFTLFAGGCNTITKANHEFEIDRMAVILTFDDGPNSNADTTAHVLDVLKKHDITAMFALLGVNATRNPELTRRIHDEGHFIINHGYSDKFAINMKNGEFRENLRNGEAAITEALGAPLNIRLYRPHGDFYRRRHERIWQEEGWILLGGNIRAYDAVIREAEKDKVKRRIIGKTLKKGGGIILLHDARDSYLRMEVGLAKKPSGPFNRSWIPEILEEIIIDLLEKGYNFVVPEW